MASSTSSPPAGRLIRMHPLQSSDLPSHPDLASAQTSSCPSLQPFISSILAEAESFLNSYLPSKFTLKSKSKPSPPSTATVKVFSHTRPSSHPSENEEAWFARKSLHENAAKSGTASWDEFDQGLRVNHSENEAAYTPGVIETHLVLDWSHALSGENGSLDGWREVVMEIREMVHSIPSPLNNRVFSILVIHAKRDNEFLVAQIPIETKGMAKAKYAEGGKGVTKGMYCSIERGRVVEEGKKVEWEMATASDAGGNLPLWMQKMGVPGAVVKDVGFFIEWTGKNRQS